MMIAYYVLFFTAALLSLVADKRLRIYVSLVLIIILVIFAGTRLDIDNDYEMYFKNFKYLEKTFKDFRERDVSLELCMYIIPYFFGLFTPQKLEIAKLCFITFAFLGVSTKVLSIHKYAQVFFLSVILYVSNLFFIMEMTTIRAGVAAGIFLLSIDDLEKKNDKGFFVKLALAFFFHSSSVLFIAPWIISRVKIDLKFYYYSVTATLVLALLKINVVKLLFLDRIFPRVQAYLTMMEWQRNEGTNIFSFRAIVAIVMIGVMGYYYEKLKEIKYFDLLFKIHIFSLALFFALSASADTFSLRSFELLSVVQILLYPMIVFVFEEKSRFIGWIIIFSYAMLQLVYMVEIADIYKSYRSWIM